MKATKSPTIYFDSDAETFFTDPAAKGYVADQHGLFCKGEYGFCEPILRYQAVWFSVDGYGEPNTKIFTNPTKLMKFLRDEEFLNEGGVSDDGVTRFSGVMVSRFKSWSATCSDTFSSEIPVSILISLTK